ncbi:RNA polymerase sigma-70 factor [Polaribacter batillariae]|uniref:RNA polymerase sigma-70 factor n=1 Tax=Polaribacter batillariae TaxID=2808900 RepID=A0ABX7SSQ1_9FLAO|nr:RNA polymerase sigma-70 factor [Polaribacter batillariae]QTD36912.1 RNA polymerase sigma-70 factor [Polaribacter batillariae]
MEDQELIDGIKNNNIKAFDVLFKKYYKLLVIYLKTVTKDIYLAEDIVQQVFVNLWANRFNLNINKSVKGYLYRICYNDYLNHYRKSKRQNRILENFKEEAIRNLLQEEDDVQESNIRKLRQLIELLPPVCKKVLKLSKIQGLKYDEIAEKLGVSKKTVESHMGTAFKKIRQGFENDKMMWLIYLIEFLR